MDISLSCFIAWPHLYCQKFERMYRLLSRSIHVALMLTSVENSSCTSMENSSSSFINWPHLYCQKFERMYRLLSRLINVALVLRKVENSIRTSTENSSSPFIASCTSTVKNSKECIVSYHNR